jgi:hypothetical protein
MLGRQNSVSTKPLWKARLGRACLHSTASIFEQPLVAGMVALLLYTVFAIVHGSVWVESPFPYYNYLADAFLHGQLSLRLTPPSTHDLSFFRGQYYLYWPPMPAIF